MIVAHVGSTSVPGLGGRAVVDAVILAGADEQEPFRAALLGAGFTDFPFAYVRPMLTASVPLEGRDYPVLLYLLAPDHEYVRGWLAFPRALAPPSGGDRALRRRERAAIASGRTDPRGHQQAKTPYVEDLLRRITAGGAPEP